MVTSGSKLCSGSRTLRPYFIPNLHDTSDNKAPNHVLQGDQILTSLTKMYIFCKSPNSFVENLIKLLK